MFSASSKTGGTGVGFDPHFPNVSLLLHADGANGGTTFTDSSSNNITMTRNGTPVISTAQGKFNQSILFTRANGDFLSRGSGADSLFTFGTGDFTIEFQLYLNTSSATPQNLIDFRPLATTGAYPGVLIVGNALVFWVNGAARITGPSLAAGQWYHIALSRVSGQTRMFVNGSQVGSTFADTTDYLSGGATRPFIGNGGFATSPDNPLNGYMDEIRITKGVGRYTANFTVQTRPHQDYGLRVFSNTLESKQLNLLTGFFVSNNQQLALVESGFTTETATSITPPSTARAGDLMIIWHHAANGNTSFSPPAIPAAVTHSGWTVVSNITDQGIIGFAGRSIRSIVEYKVLSAGDLTTSLTLMTGNIIQQANYLVVRPNKGVGTILVEGLTTSSTCVDGTLTSPVTTTPGVLPGVGVNTTNLYISCMFGGITGSVDVTGISTGFTSFDAKSELTYGLNAAAAATATKTQSGQRRFSHEFNLRVA